MQIYRAMTYRVFLLHFCLIGVLSFGSAAFAKNEVCRALVPKELSQEAAWLAVERADFDIANRIEQQLEQRLLNGELSSPPEIIKTGSSESYLVSFKDGTRGVFKPILDDWRLRRVRPWHSDNMAQNEVAAYKLDRMLGAYLVPVTVYRSLAGMSGSLQIFVEKDAETNLASTLRTHARLKVLDYLMQTFDRSPSNQLTVNGGIVAIDNAMAFLENPPHMSFGIVPPPKILNFVDEDKRGHSFNRVSISRLKSELEPLLGEASLKSTIERLADFGLIQTH